MAHTSTFKCIDKIANTNSCAGSFARRFNANLKKTGLDFKQNLAAFPTYAEHDQYMVRPS